MLSAAAARRYARALFALARETDRVEAVRRELDSVAQTLEKSPELQQVLTRPLQPATQRRAVVRALSAGLEISESVRNFLCFLVDQRRMIAYPAIRTEFARLADEAAGRTRGELVTASRLREEQLDRLRSALSARTGQEVELSVRVDPALLGGAIAKVGDVVFDGSLRTQLAQLRGNLRKGR